MNDLEVFSAALDVPQEEQDAFVRQLCAGDELLLRKVQALLKAHKRTDHFVDRTPTRGRAPGTGFSAVGEKPGDQIGRYKLLQQIGEGGWGVVFMAEQVEPVRRRVALKIVKPGMDTKSVVAPFEAERQALAMMNHPNIAQVFDAGATASGRPYFVMELVRGVRVTDYCDQKSLPTGARLELFTQICDAVQHAHQKGIAHRDIKPSNILVSTTGDGRPLPKVIDFDIAKATTNQRLTDKTLFTEFEMLIGTPAYMSPEQAALTNVEVDTRTDIYSLGVLLYELLTGTTPFDARELLKAGLDEVRRVIRNEEPVRPSTRLGTMVASELTTISQHRKVEPPTLIREVRGDLDWIVMKALEKDPCRRYATANGLAMDIRRYTASEPISARPPSKLYRFQKILLRNKLLFAGIAVLALLLITSLLIVSTTLARERRALRDSERDKQRAEQVKRFLEDTLQGVGPSVALGRDTTMLREILDKTASSVGTQLTNQPAVEAELKSLLGRLYLRLGDNSRAEEMDRAATVLYGKLAGRENIEFAASANELSQALLAEGKVSEAEQAAIQALTIRRRRLGGNHPDVAASLNNLGRVYRHKGKLDAAKAATLESLMINRKLFGSDNLDMADSLRNLSIILGDEGNWKEAESKAREVLSIRRKLLGPAHPSIASALADVAWAAGGAGNLDEAESLEREALAMRQKLLGMEHPDVAKSLYLVGDRMRQRGNLNDAYSILSAALPIQEKLLGPDAPATLDTMRSLALTLRAEQKFTESEQMSRQILDLLRKRGEAESPRALSETETLAQILILQKKFGDAESLLDEILTPKVTKEASSADLLARRAELRARGSHWQEASSDLAISIRHTPQDTSRLALLAALLAKSHNRTGYEEFCKSILTRHARTTDVFIADQVAKASLFLPSKELDLQTISNLADRAITLGAAHEKWAMPFFNVCKALSEYRQGHYKEAAEWASKTLPASNIYARAHACAVLAMANWRLGQTAAAHEAYSKGETLVPSTLPPNVIDDPGDAWKNWLFARVSLDEASELIRPEPSDSDLNKH